MPSVNFLHRKFVKILPFCISLGLFDLFLISLDIKFSLCWCSIKISSKVAVLDLFSDEEMEIFGEANPSRSRII